MKDKLKNVGLFIRAIQYTLQLTYRSSKLMIVVYFLLKIMGQTLPLVSIYLLNILLDQLGSGQMASSVVINIIIGYVGILVVAQACGAAQQSTRDHVTNKVRHVYDLELYQKLAKLPMSIIDTSQGKDMVDEVRYMSYAITYLIEQLVEGVALLYTFCVTCSVLVHFNLGFSLLFLSLAFPGVVSDVFFELRSEMMRRKHAPDVRRFGYYRWMLTDGWRGYDF